MNKTDLIDKVTISLNTVSRNKVEISVNAILELMTETLKENGRIEIRGFGSFKIRQRRAKNGRNPKTGESVQVPPKKQPHFKPGKEMRERVNGGEFTVGLKYEA